SGSAAGDKVTYQLTLSKYWDMIQHMVFPFTGWARFLWITSAGAGLVILLIRSTALGLILVSSLLILPLPFLFVSVSHFYAERYFAPALVVVAIATGAGLGQLYSVALRPNNATPFRLKLLRPLPVMLLLLVPALLIQSVWPYVRRH